MTSETEHGMKLYEVESMVNGKHKDLTLDGKGTVVEVEDEGLD